MMAHAFCVLVCMSGQGQPVAQDSVREMADIFPAQRPQV